jgi:hypothetical protein
MQRFKIALSDELRAQLDTASKKSGESVAEEIRRRIETSFEREIDLDKPTRDLIEGLARMPAEIERETGAAWHKHAGAYEALVQAILSRLHGLKPKEGPAKFGDRPHATVSNDDPKELGSLIEFRLRRQPDFTNSPTRRLMEEELQRMGSPRVLLDTQQQSKPDQPKKRGK